LAFDKGENMPRKTYGFRTKEDWDKINELQRERDVMDIEVIKLHEKLDKRKKKKVTKKPIQVNTEFSYESFYDKLTRG
jgi:hypothetical protein